LSIARVQVEAGTAIAAVWGLGYFRPFHSKASLLQQGIEIRAHGSLVVGKRFNVDEAARQVKRV
jgi:hypothetical protein